MEPIWLASYAAGVPKEIEFNEITLPDSLSRSAARFPQRPALMFQTTAISFRELDWMVSRFAAALKVAGIRQGDRVSLVLPNIIQTATALYGVLRAGATAVLHSPRADDIALKHQFNDAKSKMAVCLDVLCPRIIALRSKCGIKQVIS
ncbi:MAG: AMP-binding protein, partial [Pseudomonadota bacterium]